MVLKILNFLDWMPAEFLTLASSILIVFGIFVICKIVKLLWDVLPIV